MGVVSLIFRFSIVGLEYISDGVSYDSKTFQISREIKVVVKCSMY